MADKACQADIKLFAELEDEKMEREYLVNK